MASEESDSPIPKEFFTVKSFGTLSGSVVAAGVVATVLSGVFGLDPKIVGLIVSVGVAYLGLFLAKRRKAADFVVTGFNGCLIYFTLVGATSFYPYLNKGTAADVASGTTNAPASPFRPWVRDQNMVEISQNLAAINRQQTKTLTDVQENVNLLEQKVERLNIPPTDKKQITSGLATNKHLILMTNTNIASRVATLKRLGVHH
jgi:hypothetical protein